MNTADIVDNVMSNARALLRRQSPMSRYTLDLLLADFERDLRRDLDELDEQHEQEIEREVEIEVELAREEWVRERRERKAARAKRLLEATS
jgi:hypothetical protein